MSAPRGPRLATIHLKGWMKQSMEALCVDIKKSSDAIGLRSSGVIRLPTERERWSILRSPFVHKKSQEQFQRKTFNRLIEFYGERQNVPATTSHDATKVVHFLRYFEWTVMPAHGSARAKVTLFSDEVRMQRDSAREVENASEALPEGSEKREV